MRRSLSWAVQPTSAVPAVHNRQGSRNGIFESTPTGRYRLSSTPCTKTRSDLVCGCRFPAHNADTSQLTPMLVAGET